MSCRVVSGRVGRVGSGRVGSRRVASRCVPSDVMLYRMMSCYVLSLIRVVGRWVRLLRVGSCFVALYYVRWCPCYIVLYFVVGKSY